MESDLLKSSFNVGKYAKAAVAALSSGAAVALTAVSDGSLSAGEIVGIVLAVLASYGVTYTVPNSPKE